MTKLLNRVKQYDENRPGFPGEHWLVLAAAVGVWLGTRRHPVLAVRIVGSLAGTALVARAVTGRKVPVSMVRWLPFERESRRRGRTAVLATQRPPLASL